MPTQAKVRVDKWLWTMRVFKTRILATEACHKGRVWVNGLEAKASRDVQPCDSVLVRKSPVVYSLRVLKIAGSRLPARDVPQFMEDITSAAELEKLAVQDSFFTRRDRGSGRPTKKERRELDGLIDKVF